MLCLFKGPLISRIADVWPAIEAISGLTIESGRDIQERTEGRFVLGFKGPFVAADGEEIIRGYPISVLYGDLPADASERERWASDGTETREDTVVIISPALMTDTVGPVAITDFAPGISFGNGIISGTKAISGCREVCWVTSVVFPDAMEGIVRDNFPALRELLEPES